VGIALLFFMGFFFYSYGNSGALSEIDDFESCASAPGSAIMESYPEQCRTRDGRTFVNEKQRRDFDNQEDREEEPAENLSLAERCEAAGGKWLADYNECEGASSGWCSANGGSFDECASACRHNSNPGAPCILLCVPICQF